MEGEMICPRCNGAVGLTGLCQCYFNALNKYKYFIETQLPPPPIKQDEKYITFLTNEKDFKFNLFYQELEKWVEKELTV